MEEWKTYAFGTAGGTKPEKAVLMLHGYGSNGQDLISLAPYLAEAAPKAVFLSPDAPFVCDMSAPGYSGGRQWFPLQSFDPGYMLEGIKRAEPVLNRYIDQVLQQLELQDRDLALLGFSQGAMMSLYAAPRRKQAIAGVIGYSGALLGEAELSGPSLQKMPVVLIHGEDDQVVPFDRHEHAKNALKSHGFDIEALGIPGLSHSIDETGIKTGAAFLERVFSR